MTTPDQQSKVKHPKTPKTKQCYCGAVGGKSNGDYWTCPKGHIYSVYSRWEPKRG